MGENEMTLLDSIVNNFSSVWPYLLGSGGLIGGIVALYNLFTRIRNDKRKFDIKMNELIAQNKQLIGSLIPYVPRASLEIALQEFLYSNFIVCAILGPAGSGKTRFAQNITKRNSWFSKFHYIYILTRKAAHFFLRKILKIILLLTEKEGMSLFLTIFLKMLWQ